MTLRTKVDEVVVVEFIEFFPAPFGSLTVKVNLYVAPITALVTLM